jgi:23S rRNA (guanosine2251-2'-O)-methyltransferase
MARRDRPGRRAGPGGRDLLHGLHVIEEALLARRRRLDHLWIRPGPARPELAHLVALAREAGVPTEQTDLDALLEGRAGSEAHAINHQGALLEAGALPEFGSIRALCDFEAGAPGTRRFVALDGVEDPQNVGAIARVADAAGATGLILTERRSAPITPTLSRASAGAIEWLNVARVPNLARGLEDLKQAGFWTLGADPDAPDSLYDLPDRLLAGDLVVVLGAEGPGLRPSVRKALDHPVRLPMRGRVASLNVATAGAAVLFELLRRAETGAGPGDSV